MAAGSQARVFLTWMRLTGGPAFLRERRDKRDWEGRPPTKDSTSVAITRRRADWVQEQGAAGIRSGEERTTITLAPPHAPTTLTRTWQGEAVRSRAHTAQHQYSERARRLFAEANAHTHERKNSRFSNSYGGSSESAPRALASSCTSEVYES